MEYKGKMRQMANLGWTVSEWMCQACPCQLMQKTQRGADQSSMMQRGSMAAQAMHQQSGAGERQLALHPAQVCTGIIIYKNYKNDTKQLDSLINLLKLLLSTVNNIIIHIPLYASSASDHLSIPLLLHQTSILAGQVEQWCSHGTM